MTDHHPRATAAKPDSLESTMPATAERFALLSHDLLQLKPGGDQAIPLSPRTAGGSADQVGVNASTLTRRAVLIGTAASLRGLIAMYKNEASLRSPVGCIVVDEENNENLGFVSGMQVLGGLNDLPLLHQAVGLSVAVVALAPGSVIRQAALARCCELGLPVREVPTLLASLLTAQSLAPSPGPLNLSELVGRTPHGIDRRAVARVLEGRRVLVTGAGGSIGSEICRIVATFAPQELIFVERSENALFEIDRFIGTRFPSLARRAVLHDCTDEEGTLGLLARTRPHTVFHAAAHKHVPLMEDHPSAAITNNVLGTKSVADASLACGAERFVMISSDKAVNPSSIMGATKRLGEMYLQSLGNLHQATNFCMVRFGNVLGSACSVLPIWAAQLAEGGPLTVTDNRMTRYFMTIHEAASLVIQASTIEHPQPSIYVLDMGEPVKILDLARRFARLQGFEPLIQGDGDADLPTSNLPRLSIRLTGIRPGEKLHEQLAYAAELLEPTAYPGISSLRDQEAAAPVLRQAIATGKNHALIDQLRVAAACGNPQEAAATVRALAGMEPWVNRAAA